MDPKSKSQELFVFADKPVQEIVKKAVQLERSKRGGEGKNHKAELVKFIKEIVS